LQARLLELLYQIDAHASWHECKKRVGPRGSDFGELRLEIEVVQRHKRFLYNFTLVVPAETGNRVLSALIVRDENEDALISLVLSEFADCLVDLVVLVGRHEEVGVAVLTGVSRWTAVATDKKGAGVH